MVKNPPAISGDIRDMSSIPGLGRSPGGGNGKLAGYSYGVANSQTQFSAYFSLQLFSTNKFITELMRISLFSSHVKQNGLLW